MSYVAAGMAGLQLVGGYFASQNIKESARLNQEIAEMNAEFAELDAYDAIISGESEQARYQSIVDQTTSQQRAILAAKGVDTSFGSASSIEQETQFIAEMNLMEIEKRAQEQALGYKSQARQFRMSGEIEAAKARQQAGNVLFQSVLGAGKTALSGYSPDGSASSSPSIDLTTTSAGSSSTSVAVPASNDFLNRLTL